MNVKLAIGLLVVAMVTAPSLAVAQANTDDSTQTATGCIQKGPNGNVYVLTDENGKMWDLHSKTVSLSAHVGHTVTVTGTIPKEPAGSADTAPQNHLLVTKLEMVRDSCKQP